MKKLVAIVLILVGTGAILAWREFEVVLDRQAIYGFLDRLVFSTPVLRSSKLSALLDARAGLCILPEDSAAIMVGGKWIVQSGTAFPFGQPVRAAPSVVLGKIGSEFSGFAACRDSNGAEFRLKKKVGPLVLQLDRGLGRPIRITLLSGNEMRIVGKGILVLLHSPLGDLEVRSLADTEISVEMVADSSENLFRQMISVLSGQVHIERKAQASIGPDAGMIELGAQKDGRLEWENQKEVLVEGRSATVLPSGFYWNGSQTQAPEK